MGRKIQTDEKIREQDTFLKRKVIAAVIVFLVLGVGGFVGMKFYLPKLVDARIQEQIRSQVNDQIRDQVSNQLGVRVNEQISGITSNLQQKNDQLAEIVKTLEARQQKLESLSSERKTVIGFKVDFDRWSCWCDLKNKLLRGDEYSAELKKFQNTFADSPNLLKMVDSFVSDQDLGQNSGQNSDQGSDKNLNQNLDRNSDQKNESKLSVLMNNLRRFAKIRRVSESELEKIAGYVLLSSIRKVEENE